MEDKARLGRLLVESNLITEEQLRMATDFRMPKSHSPAPASRAVP